MGRLSTPSKLIISSLVIAACQAQDRQCRAARASASTAVTAGRGSTAELINRENSFLWLSTARLST